MICYVGNPTHISSHEMTNLFFNFDDHKSIMFTLNRTKHKKKKTIRNQGESIRFRFPNEA